MQATAGACSPQRTPQGAAAIKYYRVVFWSFAQLPDSAQLSRFTGTVPLPPPPPPLAAPACRPPTHLLQ